MPSVHFSSFLLAILFAMASPECLQPGISCNPDESYHLCIPGELETWTELPAGTCPKDYMCDSQSRQICVPKPKFTCLSAGLFADPDPCSPMFHICIEQQQQGGYTTVEGSCPIGYTFDRESASCEVKLECTVDGSDVDGQSFQQQFRCASPGKFPSDDCRKFHVCSWRGNGFFHIEKSCHGFTEFSASLRRCVPPWMSGCSGKKTSWNPYGPWY